ncbi:transposase-like protein [Bradyrhizobium sp. USDA 4520]
MSAPSSGTRTFHMIEAVADRLEGAPRQLRRRWSDEFKAQVVMALVDGMDWKRVRTAAVKPPEIVG